MEEGGLEIGPEGRLADYCWVSFSVSFSIVFLVCFVEAVWEPPGSIWEPFWRYFGAFLLHFSRIARIV